MAAIKGKPTGQYRGGAPEKIEIDFDQLESLCAIQCTAFEVASFFRISVDTLERRVKEKYGITFAEYYKGKSSLGKVSLRRRQFRAAVEDGSVPMMIWLGKNLLGQTDKQENTYVFPKPKVIERFNGDIVEIGIQEGALEHDNSRETDK